VHNRDSDEVYKAIKNGYDVEINLDGHTAAVIGIGKPCQGDEWTLVIAHDTDQRNNSNGTKSETLTWDISAGKLVGTQSRVNGQPVSRNIREFVIECKD
jgi:hypothetical protein